MKRFLYLFALLMLIAVTACKSNNPGASTGPLEQKIAPEITIIPLNENSIKLSDLKGKVGGNSIKLSDLRGKVVLLNFWATWCPPCREEIPSMMKLNSTMAGKPFRMIAVSVDEGGKQAVESFFQTSGFMLPAYIDPGGKAATAYGITGVPETFIIDKNGIIVKKVIGPFDWDGPEASELLNGLMK